MPRDHYFGSLNKILRFMEDILDTQNVMTSGLSPLLTMLESLR